MSFVSQPYHKNNSSSSSDQKRLNMPETEFTEREKKINSLENELQTCKESKQLIRNLNRMSVKIKLGHKNWRLLNQNLMLEKFIYYPNIFGLVKEAIEKLEKQINKFLELEEILNIIQQM